MTTAATRQIRLVRTPAGIPTEEDFECVAVALPALEPGQVRVAPTFLSLDPYLRLQMAKRHLSGNLLPGQPVISELVGTITESNDPRLEPGQTVAGFGAWADLTTIAADGLRTLDFGALPPSLALGVLGMPGLTAYAGVSELLKPGPDDVLVVSAAAGPVGSTVGQLALARGATVIGIAGGPEKCRWVVEEAGFSACIDHRSEDIATRLRELVPQGPSQYFDNVGGELLRTILVNMKPHGRIALCGIMDDYNSDTRSPGPLPLEIIGARATLMGLVVYDYEHLRADMISTVAGLIEAKKFAWREDVSEGLESAPSAFVRLMQGRNFGKTLVHLKS
ncbi:NADP-dependent oxidoreductase [Polymorphobacter sp.]|uniref:NADP-dependent oxidoreductase n=1 Tax=Polymorphobacter sp. TaxID=1909290 RepID=UPI003F70BBA4